MVYPDKPSLTSGLYIRDTSHLLSQVLSNYKLYKHQLKSLILITTIYGKTYDFLILNKLIHTVLYNSTLQYELICLI